MEFRGRQADVEIGAQRSRNLRRKELAQALAGDTPDYLANQVAVRERVIPRGCSWSPPRSLPGKHGGRFAPVVNVVERNGLFPARDTRCVRQKMANLDPRFALGRELGPVIGDVRVEVEYAAIDKHERGEC